jgi:hypothetical protein
MHSKKFKKKFLERTQARSRNHETAPTGTAIAGAVVMG